MELFDNEEIIFDEQSDANVLMSDEEINKKYRDGEIRI